jgi:VCBS repeat-containing protein
LSIADVDAGAGAMSVTLAVTAGSLTATSGGGVTVAGSGTGSLTLTGTLADINNFLAGASAPIYVPVADANGAVTLTMTTSDGGNTGAGGTLTDVDTRDITVNPVNDAPVNTLPAAGWTTNEDTSVQLTGLAIADIDAGTGTMSVTLNVASGALTATSGGGVAVAGSGTGTLVLTGTLADLNAFLAGAAAPTYVPVADGIGAVALTMTTSDSGNTGSGGTLSDIDTRDITIDAVNDAPINTLPATGWATSEDTSVQLTGISIADIDAASGAMSVTLAVASGSLTAASAGGVTVAGSGTGSLVLTGTLADLNAFLGGASAPTYVPLANANGTVALTMTTDDGGNTGTGGPLLDTDTRDIVISAGNDAPVANDDTFTVAEDGSVTIDVLGNDSDLDGDSLAVTHVDGQTITEGGPAVTVANGSVTLVGGQLVFAPNANYNGPISFTYAVSDGNGGTATATVTGTVTPVNDAPTGSSPPVATPEDTAVNGAVTASDIDGDPLTFTLASGPSNGTVTLNLDGTYTYTPDADYNGVDSFIVTVSDGNGGSADVTVAVTVTPVNDPPVASSPPITTAEDTPANGAITASDIDGDTLTFTLTTPPAHGTLTLNPDGTFTYTPDADYNGTDGFTVTVSDGNGGSVDVTVPVTVTPVNDAPVAANDSAPASEDTPVTGNVLGNDTDVDGDTLSVTQFTIAGDPTIHTAGDTATIAGIGTIIIAGDGSYTFTPAANYNGPVPAITYTVDDGQGGSDQAVLTIGPVAPINDAPVASDDTITLAEDGTATIDVLANDNDFDGDTLTITEIDGQAIVDGGSAVAVANGTVQLVGGQLVFTPNADYNGPIAFTYTVSDGEGGTASANVTGTVTPVNDAPTGSALPLSTPEDTPVTGAVSASDIDGDALTFALTDGPDHGTLSLNPDGSYAYTPDPDYNGPDSFTITVSDGNGGSVDVVVPVTVTPVNDAPTGSSPPVVTAEDTPFNGAITASDVDGDALTYTLSAAPTHGTLTLNADGSFTYTPDPDYNGADSFVVTISDGNGGNFDVTVPVTVTPVNDAPVASADPLTTPEDTPATGAIVASDVDGDTLTYSLSTPPAHGTLTLNPDGSYSYTPDPDYNGADSFTVTVSDGNGGSVDVTVPVTVTPVNDAPAASSPPITTPEDTPVNGAVTATDVDGDTLTYAVISDPAHGEVTINPDGTYTYTPDPNFHGSDSFTVTVSDGHGGTVDVVVPVTVTPVNDAPVASAEPLTTPEDTPATGAITASDIDGDTLTYTLSTAPAHGTLTLNPDGTYSYAPDPDYNGPDSFTVTVADGNGGSIDVTVPVTVTPVNDAPVASSPPITTAEDTPVNGTVTASDVDGDPLTYALTGGPAHGEVTVNPDGTYTYTPDPDFHGTDTFTVTVSDDQGGTVDVVIPVTVTPVNDAPTASAPPLTTPENTPATGAFTANDVDGDTLTYTLSTPPAHGVLTLNPDGTYSYAPDPDYNGSDSFTVTVADGNGGTVDVTVPVTVVPVNDAPVASSPPVTTAEDTPVSGAVTASDVDGDTLDYALTGEPAHGVVTVHPDGSYTYTPDPDFNGTDSFTITVSDGNGGTVEVTIPVTVTPVNDAPVAANDTVPVIEDTPVTGNVLGNDSDIDGDTLSVTQFTIAGDATVHPAGSTVMISGVGTVRLNTDGSFSFAPAANYNGPVPAVTYTISDGNGETDTAVLTFGPVTPVNDAPTASSPPVITAEDTPVSGTVTASDIDGDTLTFTVTGRPAHGSVTVNPDGTYTYTPARDFHGSDSFTITVSDGRGGTTHVTIPVTVTPVNDAPTAEPGSAMTRENTPITLIPVVGDVDGDPLTVTGATATNGTIIVNPDGSLTFTPATDFLGNATITYTVSDGHGGIATATIIVTVVDPVTEIDPPVVLPDPDPLPGPGHTSEGIVVPTANNAQTLGGIASLLQERGVVVATVNQIAGLNGMAGLAAEGEVLRAVEQANWQSWTGDGRDDANAEADRAIGSAGHDAAGGELGHYIVVDAVVREGTIYVQITDNRGPGARDAISEYRVTQADGRALPDWLRIVQKGVLIGERPAGIETIDLAILATTADGEVIEEIVTIDLKTGEVIRKDSPAAERTGSLFSEQLTVELLGPEREATRLLAALSAGTPLPLGPH